MAYKMSWGMLSVHLPSVRYGNARAEVICFADLQVVYMALVGSFPFNSFLSGVLSCVGTAVLAGEGDMYTYLHLQSATHVD